MNDKNKKICMVIIAIIVVVMLIIIVRNFADDEYEVETINAVVSDVQEEQEDDTIKIHITGEVINPGLLELQSGDRISDAIEKAGGTTELADTSKVNLAYILSDGEKIYIPSVNDEDEDYSVASDNTSSSKININTATAEELQSLNGIGESIAASIVSYREKNGKFSTIEEIKNVSGIGDAKFEKIKDDICVK